MAEIEQIIIDDSNENWCAVVEFCDKTAWLNFRTKPRNMPIQGNVDGALGWKDAKIGVNGLVMTPDDGFFIVDFSDYTDELAQQIKQPLLEYFKTLYEKNKEKFVKRLSRDVKDYEDEANSVVCQSCGKYPLDKRKPNQFGTEEDGTISIDYCKNCYKKGTFTEDLIMEQMIDKGIATWAQNVSSDKVWLKESWLKRFPNLKRWKE